jgi:hypothetical protein
MIYLFLSLISPQEVAYMLDNAQLLLNYSNDLLPFFKTLLRPLFIILLANLYLLSHKFNAKKTPIVAVIAILLISGLYDDFLQFYAINQHYSNYNWSHINLENSNDSMYKNNYIGI